MKTEQEIRDEIARVWKDYGHVLKGRLVNIHINAPVALMQIAGETKLRTLYWCLGEVYKSQLKRSK